MGLTWSNRKCKNDTMIVAKAIITPEVKDDVWLMWNTAKSNPKLKELLKADGLSLTKDTFDGHRWKVIWFYKCDETSFDPADDEDEDLLVWQQTLNNITHKWLMKLAAMKDAIAGSDSDKADSVEDPYA